MKADLLRRAAELSARGEPFALATVVRREAPVSAQVGDTAVVTKDGTFHGWVGGSCTRPTVVSEAGKALADGRPRLIALAPDAVASPREGVALFPMTCHSGGTVEIYIEPVLPAPRLMIFGVSPTARALARLGRAMGYTVVVVDAHADASGFPEADAIFTDPKAPAPATGWAAPVYAVVATHGEWDEDALLAALGHDPAYLGVVASPKRFASMRELLAGRVSEAAFARVQNPAGLDLGARGAEEVALSILAEIIRRRHEAAPQAAPTPAAVSALPSFAPPEAVDPVCGMTVAIPGARHRAEHEGREYFFCCAGCRERFVKEPARYLAAADGP